MSLEEQHEAFLAVLDEGTPVDKKKHHIKRSQTETALAIQAAHNSTKQAHSKNTLMQVVTSSDDLAH